MSRRRKYDARRDAIYTRNYNRLKEIAMSRFSWLNLPDTCDERFLERALCSKGKAIFFEDEIIGYLTLNCTIGSGLDVYQNPINREAYASNGYQRTLNNTNSVIIYNNMLKRDDLTAIDQYALTLTEIEYSYLINCKAQKTPILLEGTEKQMTTLLNMYEDYDGNAPVMMKDKSNLSDQPIRAISTGAPFVADKLYDMKSKIWNEALTYLGIPNITESKKERLITDEVDRMVAGTLASRNSALETRKHACDQINKMFGLNIDVVFRDGTAEFNQLNNEGGDANDSMRVVKINR